MRAFLRLAWIRPVALALLMLASALLPASAAQPLTLVQIGSDPYTDPASQHRTAVEPDTFSYGSTIVAAFQVGRFSSSGAANNGWASSRDAGGTWTSGVLPGIVKLEGGPYDRATDPSVAYDAKHGVWMISSLALSDSFAPGQERAILVSRSTDDGITWTSPVTVTTGSGLDKNWTVCDNSLTSPYYGNCYTQWNASGIFMSTSIDGGLTWGLPLAPGGFLSGLGGQPVVQPNGTVIVPFTGLGGIGAFRSIDGGASWSSAVSVAQAQVHRPAGGLRFFLLPSAEIDGAGKVYVVWHDCRFRPGCTANDIVISTSLDGITWSPVTRIPIDEIYSGVDHFIPGLGVDRTTACAGARLALAFYYYPVANCTPETCGLHVGFVSWEDGGASWSERRQLAGPMQMSWLPPTNGGRMTGDYISTSFVQGKAFPVFSVAGPPQGGLFDQAIYTAIGDLNQPDELPSGCVYVFLPLVQNAMPAP